MWRPTIARLRMETMAAAVWPFVMAMLAAPVVVTLWPGLST
jgi:TRAP-type C4-dicarboxylate transport system permease large subunit